MPDVHVSHPVQQCWMPVQSNHQQTDIQWSRMRTVQSCLQVSSLQDSTATVIASSPVACLARRILRGLVASFNLTIIVLPSESQNFSEAIHRFPRPSLAKYRNRPPRQIFSLAAFKSTVSSRVFFFFCRF